MSTWNLSLLTAGHCLSSKELSEIKDSNWFDKSQFFHSSSTKLRSVSSLKSVLKSSAVQLFLYSILIVTAMN